MTLEEFDALMQMSGLLAQQGRLLSSRAQAMEDFAYALAGLEHHQRDPGFPGWTYEGGLYCQTPREALKEKLEREK